MADLTAKRTLVKSPPELWTELSEVEGLARHLGEFGEIHITRVEPEKTVAWEGEHASGTVEIEASGWGTKVTLTAELAEPEAEVAAPEAVATLPDGPEEGEAAVEAAAERGQDPATGQEPVDEAPTQPEPEPEPEPAPPTGPDAAAEAPLGSWSGPRSSPPQVSGPVTARWEPARTEQPAPPAPRGFLSRLLRRRSRTGNPGAGRAPTPPPARPQAPPNWQQPAWHTRPEPTPTPPPQQAAPRPEPEPAPMAAAEPAAANPEPVKSAAPAPAPAAPHAAWLEAAPTAEPVAADEPASQPEPALAPEKALAVLEGALDSLGAAHHRPFSRG